MSPNLSWHRRLLLIGLLVASLVVAGAVAVVGVGAEMSESYAIRIEDYAEERELANRAMQALMLQLSSPSNPDPVTQFESGGDDVRAALDSYAAEELTPAQATLLETLRETHAAMEQEATRAYLLFLTGSYLEALESWGTEIGHGQAFIEGLESFLQLRQEGLVAFREQQDATLALLYSLAGILAVVVIGGGSFAAWTINQRVARPLHRLADASGRIERGDLGARVPLEPDPEFGAVALSFNSMAEKLQETTADLMERNAELTHALAQVRETQEELIQSEKIGAMGRMTAGLAHELNNPLSSILGFGQLLNEELAAPGDASAEELRSEFLHPILESASRARSLVQEFLQLARKSPTNIGAVPLNGALEQVRTQLRPAANDAGVELRFHAIPDVFVAADRVMLEGIFLNILRNAVEAVEEQGESDRWVSVEGTVEGDAVTITIDDSGPGLAHPDKVFEPFYTTKPVGKGTGLGLALSHQFASAFGGRIRAQNHEDGGARFQVDLRLCSDDGDEPESGCAELSSPEEVASPAHEEDNPASRSHHAAAAAEGIRVLVIEDEPPLRELQRRLLERVPAQALLAGSAEEARVVLGRQSVDAVICDVKMPGEGGYAFYEWLALERPELAERFLFVTGDVSNADVARVTEQWPDRVLGKPFDVSEYLSRVSRLLRSATV